jgi:hypothetical protein
VNTNVVVREIAAAAPDLRNLRAAAGIDLDPSADRGALLRTPSNRNVIQ